MSNKTFTMSFGTPEHGWLPVRLASSETALEFHASDVPIDPIPSLITSAIQAGMGIAPSAMVWDLEPVEYRLELVPRGELLMVTVTEVGSASDVLLFEAEGQPARMLRTIWHALRALEDQHNVEPHWPATDFSQLAVLKEFVDQLSEERPQGGKTGKTGKTWE